MKQPNRNFLRDPLVLGCYFDPREEFYSAGFDDYGVQWSFDHYSTIKALEGFIKGTGTFTEVTFPVGEILAKDPVVIVKFDIRSGERLAQEAKKQNSTPEDLLKNLLKVTRLKVVYL